MDQPHKVLSLLLAGHRSQPDPLCTHYDVKYKSLISIADQMMITYPLKTLLSTQEVRQVRVLTQEPEVFEKTLDGNKSLIQSDGDLSFEKSAGTIAGTILDQIKSMDDGQGILVTTADNCLLRPCDVEEFLRQATASDADIAIGFVEKSTLLAKYPAAQRTWMKFSDRSVTGCNLFLIRSSRAKQAIEFWSKIEADRKKVFKMAFQLGPIFFLQYWLGKLSVMKFFDKISTMVNCNIKAIYMSDPDIAQDADKLVDIEQIEAILKIRGNGNNSGAQK